MRRLSRGVATPAAPVREVPGPGSRRQAYRDTKRAQKFIEDKNLTYTFLENGEDDAEVVQSLFGVRGYPTSFVIDRDGRIMYAHLGFEPGDEIGLEEEIQSLL